MTLLGISIGIFILATMVIGGFLCRRYEKREWNKGYCRETGYPWKSFDMDSSGARGYKDGFGNYLWVSYGVDR
jgi:hypothetical protein